MKRILSLSFIFVLSCCLTACNSESTVVHETATPQAMTGNTCGSEDDSCPPGQTCINGKCTKTDDEPIPAQKEEPAAQIPDEGSQIQCDEHSCECDKTTCDQPDSCWRVAGFKPNVVCLDDGFEHIRDNLGCSFGKIDNGGNPLGVRNIHIGPPVPSSTEYYKNHL